MTDIITDVITIPILMFIIYAVWGIIFEFILIVLMYWLFPPHRRARFLSFLTKKAYGVVEIFGKGKHATLHIANFYKDFARERDGIYFYDPSRVYIKDGARTTHFDEADAFEPIKIEETTKKGIQKIGRKDEQKLIQMGLSREQIKAFDDILKKHKITEIKRIYFTPKEMSSMSTVSKEKRDPKMIDAVFMKQKALAESEALVKIIKKLMLLLIIAAGAAIISALIGYLVYDIVSGGGIVSGLAKGV